MNRDPLVNSGGLDPQAAFILAAIEGIYIVIDLSGKIVSFHNQLKRRPGQMLKDLTGRNWFDLFKALKGRISSRKVFQTVVANRDPATFISETKSSEDNSLFLKWHLKPIRSASGSILSIGAIGQTIPDSFFHADQIERENMALLKRTQELTALYGISQVIVEVDRPFEEKLRAIIDLLLPVFSAPDRMAAHIRLDGVSYGSADFESYRPKLTEDVVVRDEKRGAIQVGYVRKKHSTAHDKFTFLAKEQQFLHKVARLLAFKLEKRELVDQLKHADRLATIGQLAAGIAHEINNPLNDILGFAQLISSQPDLPEETYQDIEKIVKSSLYAREIIKKVLFFSRQSHPKVALANLNRMVTEWMAFFQQRCTQSDIRIVLKLDPNLPATRCDSGQLNQVLVNLVINAIAAMPKGGTLTIRTSSSDEHISIAIQDTGIGIKAEIFDKIFLPFFTTKDVDQGTGLGLSVVYGIIKEHGGTITTHSIEGEGATFEVRLPRPAIAASIERFNY
jgi:two-component system NtrC family sensor kinase